MKTIVSVALVVLAFVERGAAQQAPGAVVLSAAPREWTVNGKPIAATINPGDEVVARAAGELELSCVKPERVLLVYSCRSQVCRVRACELTGEGMEVKRPIRLADRLSAFAEWTTSLIRRRPIPPVIAAARAGGNPSDAVLLQDARGVHWGGALTRVLEGRVCFLLNLLPESSNRALTFAFEWDRAVDAEGISAVQGVTPGLYALEKGAAGVADACQRDPDAVPAWVLIVQAGDFGRVNSEWQQRLASIDDLDRSGATLAAVTTIRQAALADLARSFPPR
jgi:hypothetical protein